MVWPSYLCLAQNYYDLVHHAQNYYNLEKINEECLVCQAQNYYDLEKINVEWSGLLTTVRPKIIKTSKK